jgi:hypothetical protein
LSVIGAARECRQPQLGARERAAEADGASDRIDLGAATNLRLGLPLVTSWLLEDISGIGNTLGL